ncbi:unnamed protein product [Pleuronectes platessa]|uniref:Uncharacterized protein n=1 Tax=Pleuronectes platessa TaxID=8262 RepID=A0A9N7W1L1_PLEPL|nr:unnamed protein product [Pleuronectes platessa]
MGGERIVRLTGLALCVMNGAVTDVPGDNSPVSPHHPPPPPPPPPPLSTDGFSFVALIPQISKVAQERAKEEEEVVMEWSECGGGGGGGGGLCSPLNEILM